MKLSYLIVLFSCALPLATQPPGSVNREARLLADFDRRVKEYVKLHKAARSEVHRLKPTNSAEKIGDYQRQLALRIRAARVGARQGNIFTPEIAVEIRRLIGITMQGSGADRIRESLRHAEPAKLAVLRANGDYPDAVPLQSTPPSLLLNLPPLPPEIDYRVVGHDLVLRDTEANLIVDYITNAIP